MSKKSTMARRMEVTDMVVCHRDGEKWGEYVRAGHTYVATYPRNGQGKRQTIHMQGNDGATSIVTWAFMDAIKRGDLEIVGY